MRTPDDPVSESRRLRAVTILALAAVVLASSLVAYLKPYRPVLPKPAAVEVSLPQHFQYVTNTSFLDGGHAWVMSSLSPRPESYIYRTSDGGRHWRTLQPPVPVADFSFIDARHGFASGREARLLVTGDGGDSWQVRQLPEHSSAFFRSITFISASDGWYLSVGPIFNGGGSAWLDHTTDGGQTWQELAATTGLGDHESGLALAGYKSRIWFSSSRIGWLESFESGRRSLYLTEDGGRSWQLNPYPASDSVVETARWFSGLEGLIGVSFGPGRGAIYKTYDGGGEWFTALTPVLGAPRPELVTPAGILDRSHWWLADANRLWRTSDGGKSWSVVNLKIPGGLKLSELHPVGPHELWGLAARHPGQDGDALLFYSGDAGASWQPVALPSGL